jgi:hypothetical protein
MSKYSGVKLLFVAKQNDGKFAVKTLSMSMAPFGDDDQFVIDTKAGTNRDWLRDTLLDVYGEEVADDSEITVCLEPLKH